MNVIPYEFLLVGFPNQHNWSIYEQYEHPDYDEFAQNMS